MTVTSHSHPRVTGLSSEQGKAVVAHLIAPGYDPGNFAGYLVIICDDHGAFCGQASNMRHQSEKIALLGNAVAFLAHPETELPGRILPALPHPAPETTPMYPDGVEFSSIGDEHLRGLIGEVANYGFTKWVYRNGVMVAGIIPGSEVHEPGTCCCKNCPWGGKHDR